MRVTETKQVAPVSLRARVIWESQLLPRFRLDIAELDPFSLPQTPAMMILNEYAPVVSCPELLIAPNAAPDDDA